MNTSDISQASLVTVYEPRDWQKSAFKKIDSCLTSESYQIMAVNACVGSGKTDLGSYAFAKTIENGIAEDHKTVSVFVSPRIKLCDQQQKSISNYIDPRFPELKDKYSIFLINCEADPMQFDRKTGHLNVKHAIFVFCDASLWGNGEKKDEKDNAVRWNAWLGHFTKWSEENGFKLGSIFFDEAHNYDRCKDKVLKLSTMFQLTMLASGTPSAFQREISKSRNWRKNTCECSPAEAMEKKMICKPSLNLITGNASTDFPNAILVALKREIEICKSENFAAPCMLVNCSGIDQINSILKYDLISQKIGHDFHVITIHSAKGYADDEGMKNILLPQIDGKDVESRDAYDVIEKLDDGYFDDDLPVIVFQVGMIGEGINVKSFSSTIVTTHTDKTAMQQIGRAVRDFKKNGKTKINDGHANVYAFFDNVEELKMLIVNLQNYDLTDACFDWGKKIDVSGSSSPEHNGENDCFTELNEFSWSDLNGTLEVITIMSAAEIKTKKIYTNEFIEDLLEENADKIEWLIKEINDPEYVDKMDGGKPKGISFNDFMRELESEKKDKKDKKSESKSSSKSEKSDKKTEDKKSKKTSISLVREMVIENLIAIKRYARDRKDFFTVLYHNPETRVKLLIKILRSTAWAKFFSSTISDKMLAWVLK